MTTQTPPIDDLRVQNIQKAIVFLLGATLALVVLGVIMVYSATTPITIRLVRENPNYALFDTANKHLVFALGGVLFLAIAARIPFRLYEKLWLLIVTAAVGLQLLIFSPLGKSVGGNTNWLRIGSITVQPSEFLKVAMILAVAIGVKKVGQPTYWDKDSWKYVHAPAGIAIGSVLAGKDLGTVLVMFFIYAVMMWVAGVDWRLFLAFGLAGSGLIGIMIAIQPTRYQRILAYFGNLFKVPDIYKPTQPDIALWAFGTGGISGVGLGGSKEKWSDLAAAHTDYIFAVIGEELGMLGCFVVILLFLVVGISLLYLFFAIPNRVARYVALGTAAWIFGQALANMMVVTGLLPVFGVPLPFISQGGSAIFAGLVSIGVVLSGAFTVPGVREGFKVRPHIASRTRAVIAKGD